MSLKVGRLTKEEKKCILDWCLTLTPQEIADKLDRRLVNIEKFLEENGPVVKNVTDDDKRIANVLHGKIYWSNCKEQFSQKEIDTFEVYWIEYFKQFNEDVAFSEENQIVDLIKLRLLADRNLVERNKVREEQEELEERKKELIKEHGSPPHEDQEIHIEYETLVGTIRSVEASLSSRMNELKLIMDKIQNLTRELNATREQRAEMLKKSKKDWISLMKGLRDDKYREKEGRELELMKLAHKKEKDKLSQYHQYADQTVDKPLFNSESV